MVHVGQLKHNCSRQLLLFFFAYIIWYHLISPALRWFNKSRYMNTFEFCQEIFSEKIKFHFCKSRWCTRRKAWNGHCGKLIWVWVTLNFGADNQQLEQMPYGNWTMDYANWLYVQGGSTITGKTSYIFGGELKHELKLWHKYSGLDKSCSQSESTDWKLQSRPLQVDTTSA